jgi:ABC-type glycerol-3-phosphate transport system substrate-binding protein
MWGVVDDLDAYQPILDDFRKTHPYVEVQFRRFRLEEYEGELLNALAEDRGPDLFLIHNTWVNKYLPKIAPMPKQVKSAVLVASGSQGKDAVYQTVTTPTISLRSLKNEFADVVAPNSIRNLNVSTAADKQVMEDRVVALPMSVDTLGLYYNKDLLNAAGIPTPPETWDQFQAQVKKLVKLDANDKIVQAGAGIGTGANVERAPDILSLVMMQNGTVMTDEAGYPTFTATPPELEGKRDNPPAFEALGFYTDFANPGKDVYTWNKDMPNSLVAFVQGTSAFFLGYSYELPLIKAQAPKLNLGISKVPQIAGSTEVNFANYWEWAVSKKSASQDLAWLLVNEMMGPTEVVKHLKIVNRPAARKSLLPDQLENESVGAFASQVLNAKTWYRGVDPKSADQALIDLIDSVQGFDPGEILNAIQTAQEKVAQTVR